MQRNYYGIQIKALLEQDQWRWQVALPTGGTLTSKAYFQTPELAITQGEQWFALEIALGALNNCLVELMGRGALAREEYRNLMRSIASMGRSL